MENNKQKNKQEDKQESEKQAPTWVIIFTAIMSLTSAVLVAYIGYTGNTRIAELQSQTDKAQIELQAEIERLNTSLKEAEVVLEQNKFDATQESRRHDILIQYIPQLLSSAENEREVAVAVLFVIYPNEAKDILSNVKKSLGEETNFDIEQVIKQAITLDEEVGEWVIAIGRDEDIAGAKDEASNARDQGYTPIIYKIDNWYVTTIGPFPTEVKAESVNITVRSKIREDAIVLNQNNWCGKPVQKNDHFECKEE